MHDVFEIPWAVPTDDVELWLLDLLTIVDLRVLLGKMESNNVLPVPVAPDVQPHNLCHFTVALNE